MAMSDNGHVVASVDGWLNVRREPSGSIVALAELTRIKFTSSENGRDFFVVQEGPERGRSFSVKAGNLRAGSPVYRSGADLEFSAGRERLSFLGEQIKAVTDLRNPITAPPHSAAGLPARAGRGLSGADALREDLVLLGSRTRRQRQQ